jgi:hypothetical protein
LIKFKNGNAGNAIKIKHLINEKYHLKNCSLKFPYPFTGKITCGNCGKHYRRKINNSGTKYEKVIWMCSTYNSRGKEKCKSKAIPEKILDDFAEQLGGIEKIKEIRVTDKNCLVFLFYNSKSRLQSSGMSMDSCDGLTINVSWSDKSRSESWTPEMKEQARQRQIKINNERRKKKNEYSGHEHEARVLTVGEGCSKLIQISDNNSRNKE